MISKAYKKLGAAKGLKAINGVCCGKICGYTVTLSDGRRIQGYLYFRLYGRRGV